MLDHKKNGKTKIIIDIFTAATLFAAKVKMEASCVCHVCHDHILYDQNSPFLKQMVSLVLGDSLPLFLVIAQPIPLVVYI